MSSRFLLCALFLSSALVVMAGGNAVGAGPGDWIDRMVADRSQTLVLAMTAGPDSRSSSDDWVGRMMSTRREEPAIAQAPRGDRPEDWVDRMVAARVGGPASPRDLLQIRQVEAEMAEAASTKDLDMMMSLFAQDARLFSGGRTYTGRDEIRTYWAHAGPFQPANHWAGYSPAWKVRIDVGADRATMHSEYLWVDTATSRVEDYASQSDVLVRAGDRWVIKEMRAGT